MEALLIYFLKMIACSGVMFLYYQLFLKDKTFHHYNRFYLIATLLISLVLPLLKVEYFTIEVNENWYQWISSFQNNTTIYTTTNGFNYYLLFIIGAGLVSVFLLGRLIFAISRIYRFKQQFLSQKLNGIQFYATNLLDAPFSFFRNLFWKEDIELESKLGQQILKHEMVHIEQKHSVDKLGSELLVALFWFNPFFHIIKKEIGLIHEYLADHKSVKNSDTKAFAQMLLASHFSGNIIPGTSPFLNSNLKKRLKMLQKPTTRYSYLRRLLALPTLFVLAFAYMVDAKNSSIEAMNITIQESLQETVHDTIKSKKLSKDSGNVTLKSADFIRKNSNDISKLNQEITTKAKEIAQLAKDKKVDTPEFQQKEKELDDLANRVNDLSNSQAFKEQLKKIDNSTIAIQGFFDSPTFRHHIKSLSKNAEYFDSPEFQKKLKEFEDISNLNPESRMLFFNKKDMDSLMKGVKLSELQAKALKKYSEINAKKAKDMAANAKELELKTKELAKFYKDQGYTFSSAFTPSKELTKKEKRKLEELNKKQAELRKKQAELSKEKAEILKNDFSRSMGLDPMDFKIFPKGNVILSTSGNTVDNVKIYVDGKEIGKGEMEKIDPKNIEKININKTNNNGVSGGEIHIKLK